MPEEIIVTDIAKLPKQLYPSSNMLTTIVDPSTGKAYGISYDELKSIMGIEALEGGIGEARFTTNPADFPAIKRWNASDGQGSYTGFGLSFTEAEFEGAYAVQMKNDGGGWEKDIKSMPNTETFINKNSDVEYEKSKQLFNKAQEFSGSVLIGQSGFIRNKVINNTGAESSISTYVGWAYVNIPIPPGLTHITVSHLNSTSGTYYRFVNGVGALIPGSNGLPGSTSFTIDLSTLAEYPAAFQQTVKRDTWTDAVSINAYMINAGNTALPYEDFILSGGILKISSKELIAGKAKDDAKIRGANIANIEDVPTVTTQTVGGNQLFDKTSFTPNQAINSTGGYSTTTGAYTSAIICDPTKSGLTLQNLAIGSSSKRYRYENSSGVVIEHGLLDASNKYLPYPPGVYMFRFTWKSGGGSPDPATVGNVIMVNYGNVLLPYENFGESETYVTKINNHSLSQPTEEKKGKKKAAGDSLTQGDDLINQVDERWTTLLSAYLGETVENLGSNGARAEEITARIGGIAPSIQITGGTIPVSGFVAVSYLDVQPMRSGGAVTSYPVVLSLPNGTQVPGVLHKTNGFTATGLSSPITVGSAIIRAYSQQSRTGRADTLFLCQGVNNEPFIKDGTQTIEDIKLFYKQATSCYDKFFVWGLADRGLGSDSTNSEAPGTIIGDFIVNMEKWMAMEYGNRFIPVRKYLISQQALADAAMLQPGFIPTENDNLAVAGKVTPPSFRSSYYSAHLNALGHKLQALFMYKWLLQFDN